MNEERQAEVERLREELDSAKAEAIYLATFAKVAMDEQTELLERCRDALREARDMLSLPISEGGPHAARLKECAAILNREIRRIEGGDDG